MAERPKARVCGRSLTGVTDSYPTWGMDICVVCSIRIKDMRTEDENDRTKTGNKSPAKVIPLGDLNMCVCVCARVL